MFLIMLYCDQGKQELGPAHKIPFSLSVTQIYSCKRLCYFVHIKLENTMLFGVKMKTARGVRLRPILSGTCCAPPTHCSLSAATLRKWQAPLGDPVCESNRLLRSPDSRRIARKLIIPQRKVTDLGCQTPGHWRARAATSPGQWVQVTDLRLPGSRTLGNQN